ncbi:squalene/phytoene synthase family protein [Jatrophihabitans sp. YIM 134969]
MVAPGGIDVLEALAGSARGQAGAENFPVALRALPRTPRGHLLAVYDFARFVDDVGDADYRVDGLPAGAEDRLRLLDLVDADLDAERPRLAPVAALASVRAAGVPDRPLHDLVEANRVDQRVGRYATFADLVAYCRLSADPVGRIVLHVADAATPDRVAWSDDVCTALQVLEHCQDVEEDAARGRVYLPQADLARGSSAHAVAVNVERAEALLRSGPPLVRSLSGWARLAVAGFVAGGLATVDALRGAGFRTTGPTVTPSKAATARHALRLLAGRG